MKVLLLINSMGAGGAERSTLELAKFLHSSGTGVLIVCLLHHTSGIEEETIRSGVPVVFLKPGNIVSRYRQLIDILKKYPVDVIHSVLFEANMLLRAVKIVNPSWKTVESLVSTPYAKARAADRKISWAKFLLVKRFDIFTAKRSRSHYHAISNIVYEHYKSLYSIKPGGHTVIYRGRRVNDKIKDRVILREELKFNDRFTLINVGRHEFPKGQILIMKALVILKERGFDLNRIRLIILGREGHYSQDLYDYVEKHDLAQHITFTGFRNDVDRYLAAGDAFVFPSYYEGLGGALIEGLASKLPVVCSDLPVLREVMGSDQSALFFESGNAEKLAECITKLVDDPTLRSRLAAEGFKQYLENFELDKIHAKMVGMYEKLCGGSGHIE
jgi:glycosyltransferase involved in cell wall biosynthesis